MTLTEWGFVVNDFANIGSMVTFLQQGGAVPDLIISDFELGADDTGDQAIAAALEPFGLQRQNVPQERRCSFVATPCRGITCMDCRWRSACPRNGGPTATA